MDINGFKQVYSILISDFRKETPRSPPFWSNKFTTTFTNWLLQERNIRITYKGQNIEIPESYNHIPEFFFNFLKEHTYFAKRRLVDDYIHNNNTPKDEYRNVKSEFDSIIRFHLRIGVLEKYSAKTYKINKEKLN